MLTTQRRSEPSVVEDSVIQTSVAKTSVARTSAAKTSVIQSLFDKPHRFDYFQSVRLLEIWFKQQGVARQQVVTDVLRFKNSVSLAFPVSELEALAADVPEEVTTITEMMALFKHGELQHIEMTPSFMGLLGGNGALPFHYTERIAEHMQATREDGPKAFLDIFSNRALGLFYESWRKYRLALKYEKTHQDHFLPLLLSLAGIGQSSLKKRLVDDNEGVLDESLAYFSAALRQKPASAAMMQKVISAYFAVPMRIQQFVGAWYTVPPGQQTQLGGAGAILGVGAMIGERVWQRDLCMKIMIGPLTYSKFEEFLPRKVAAKSLEKVLTMFTGLTIEYEVQLILRKEDVKPSKLGQDGSAVTLGWNSFLTTQHAREDSSEVRYRIHAPEVTI